MIQLNSKSLLEALKIVKPVIPNDPVLPTLECTRIFSQGNRLYLQGYNLETSITTHIVADVPYKVEFLVSIKKLIKLCEKLPLSPMVLEHDTINNKLTITCDGATFELGTHTSDDYPKLPDVGEILTQKDFDGAIVEDCVRALKFVSSDTLRPAMTGIFFDYFKNSLKIVSTDAHCLFVSDNYTGICDRSFVVPSTGMKIICGQAKKRNGAFSFTATHFIYDNENTSIIVRLIDAKYPDYQNVIPNDKNYFSVNKQSFVTAVSSMMPFADSTTRKLDFELDGKLKIEANDIDFDTTSKKEMDYRFKNTSDFFFAINGDLLLKAVSCIPANHIKLYNDGNSQKPFTIRSNDSDAIILIMPLAVGKVA